MAGRRAAPVRLRPLRRHRQSSRPLPARPRQLEHQRPQGPRALELPGQARVEAADLGPAPPVPEWVVVLALPEDEDGYSQDRGRTR